jgi:hypothetical protein
MGSSGPVSAVAEHPGGGGNDVEGSGTAALRPTYCSTATRASRAHLVLAGLVGAWCAPAAMFRSMTASQAVEAGSSGVAARLLFLDPTISCVSALQAAVQCYEATDDGEYKIVVAHAGGWYS